MDVERKGVVSLGEILLVLIRQLDNNLDELLGIFLDIDSVIVVRRNSLLVEFFWNEIPNAAVSRLRYDVFPSALLSQANLLFSPEHHVHEVHGHVLLQAHLHSSSDVFSTDDGVLVQVHGQETEILIFLKGRTHIINE